ncbi:LCP family protein, partial [Aeromonas veronii]|nr:LCP family protein [Aeromonas veronii]
GVDDTEGGLGRSDVLMLVTVNPKTKDISLISIPRDSRTYIPELGRKDKINHSFSNGGVTSTIETVTEMLDIPIDYYVQVNMESFKDIVDAVGGITVNNDLDFSYDGYTFNKGQLSLNGSEALAYSRMRKEDPRGDFGRQERQRQVIMGVIDKGASFSTLTNFGDIMGAIGK